ncbi:MAG TPA: CHAT domain-containing protein [Leptolyngbyaceae cyanobacterium]
MTQAFYLSITPLGQDRYLIRTEEVAPGVPLAEDQVTWPVEAWLTQATAHNPDPLFSLLEGSPLGSDRTAPTIGFSDAALTGGSQLIELGQTLYNALFQGRIRDSWLAAQGVAQNRRQILSLRLGFKDSRLQRLPWEVLYGDDRPLATGTDIIFARYFVTPGLAELAAMPPLPTLGQALQVLMVVSAPNDQERLALRQEVQKLKEELHPTASSVPAETERSRLRPPVDIQLTILEQPGRAELVQALEQGSYQVLHYAGHSDVSETGGDLYLVSRQTGLTERLSGEDLAGLLVNNGIWMAVFNSCRGAYTTTDDAESGWREQNLVQALVNRGVPGVIAMAERIPDNVAITFTQLLYRNLKQGYSIDLSLSRTRQGLISGYGSDQAYWMLPILYLHPEFDGYLYIDQRAPGNSSDDDLSDRALLDLEPWLLAGERDEALSLPTETLSPTAESTLDELLDGIVPEEEEGLDLVDLVDNLDSDSEPSYDEDAAVVTDLIHQLTTHYPSEEKPLDAAAEENLLPSWDKPQSILHDKLPERPQVSDPGFLTSASALDSDPVNADSSQTTQAATKNWVSGLSSQDWRFNSTFLVWAGLGLAGAIAAASFALSIASNPLSGSSSVATGDTNGSQVEADANSGTFVNGAIKSLASGDPATARRLMEKLLDQGDTQAAQAVLDTANPEQLQNSPEVAYVMGRLTWESIAKNDTDASPKDAYRDWSRAVQKNPKFVEAWIALGFAHYVLDEPQAAIKAWQQAIELDRRQVRDGDPDQRTVADPQVAQAYVGLAMAYQQLSAIAAEPSEQKQLLTQAQEAYQFIVDYDATLLSPVNLGKSWLWQPNLLAEWTSSLEALATNSTAGALTAP